MSRFEVLFDSAPDAIVLADASGRIRLVNRRTEELFGYDHIKLLGEPIEVLIPERFRAAHRSHRAAYSSDPQTWEMGVDLELYGLREDGSEFPVEISLSPMHERGETLVITIIRDASERRAAEARFRVLLESAPDAIVLVDADAKITLVNSRTNELFGYAPGDLLGETIEVLVPERLRQLHVQHRTAYVADPRTRELGAALELYGLRKDGSEFPVEIGLSALTTGSETLIFTIIRDITDRTVAEAERLAAARAQAAQTEAEAAAARLRSIHDVTEAALGHISLDELLQAVLVPVRGSLDAATARILLLDDDHGHLVVRASLGLPEQRDVRVPVGVGLAGAIASQHALTVSDDMTDVLSSQLAEAGMKSLVAAPLQVAGEFVGILDASTAAASGFTAEDAQLLQVFADRIGLAISNARLYEAERAAHDATEAAQSRLTEIVRDLDAIVWEAETPERERLTFLGGRAAEILGFPAEDWTAQTGFWGERIHPEDRERTMIFFSEAGRKQRAHELEYRLQAADGRVVWVNDKVRVVDENPGDLRVRGVMVDVTERREVSERVLHSQKMEAVGELAGGIAHDFNNLLTVISGFAKLLDVRLSADDTGTELTEICRAAEQAAKLTQQLLAFSRREPQRTELVDLNALVSDLEQMVRRLIGEDVELTISRSTEPAVVEADRAQLERVLVNLIVNARDAISRGGRIDVSVSTVEVDEEHAIEAELEPGRYARVAVADDGSGMSEQTRARIFEPFFTTKAPGKGTGLGLAIVYGIVDQGNGRIRVESEVGCGSTFTVYLRSAAAPGEGGKDEDDEAAPAATILLAEDEPALRRLARLILEEDNYRVLDAGSGRDAIELAARHGGAIDLLLTDVVMPGLGGPELASHLARLRPGLRVIYMSGYTDSRIAGQNLGGDAVLLQKPFNPEALRDAVRRLLAEPL